MCTSKAQVDHLLPSLLPPWYTHTHASSLVQHISMYYMLSYVHRNAYQYKFIIFLVRRITSSLTRVLIEELPEEAAELLLAVPHELAGRVRPVPQEALLGNHSLAWELGRALCSHLLVALFFVLFSCCFGQHSKQTCFFLSLCGPIRFVSVSARSRGGKDEGGRTGKGRVGEDRVAFTPLLRYTRVLAINVVIFSTFGRRDRGQKRTQE